MLSIIFYFKKDIAIQFSTSHVNKVWEHKYSQEIIIDGFKVGDEINYCSIIYNAGKSNIYTLQLNNVK